MPYTKPGAEKGICRSENHKFGYYACVRHQGRAITKFFSDRKQGGSEGAYKAAIKWRNETERELGIVRTNRRLDMKRGDTETGRAGVRRTKTGYQVSVSATIPIGERYSEQKP